MIRTKICLCCRHRFSFEWNGVSATRRFCFNCQRIKKRISMQKHYWAFHDEILRRQRKTSAKYRASHREELREASKRWSLKQSVMRQMIKDEIFNEVLKNPRKWLKKKQSL